ncbi:MAG: hypothetical protein GY777_05525 [Candidatus Brocadiaceae bacterium]|nr:hypothetical protein [Candidatus Brocadiaceae bacterium]
MERTINILALYYSQTGKTKNIIDLYLEPLKDNPHINIDMVEIEPETAYPFPWPMKYFFSIVPETVYENQIPLKTLRIDENKKYDLIVLGCQVWFLSPSLPISSMLQHSNNKIFQKTPVALIITCRKMWYRTFLDVKKRLEKLGSSVYEKVVVTVEGSQMGTLHGTRNNLLKKSSETWKFKQEDLERARSKGVKLAERLNSFKNNDTSSLFETLETKQEIPPETDKLEKVAKAFFLFSGKYIQKFSKPFGVRRTIFTVFFTVIFMLLIVGGIPLFYLKELPSKGGIK